MKLKTIFSVVLILCFILTGCKDNTDISSSVSYRSTILNEEHRRSKDTDPDEAVSDNPIKLPSESY